MTDHDYRGDFYNTTPAPLPSGEGALYPAKGLDFQGEESVNPEDLTEGAAPMSQHTPETATRASTLNSVDGLEHLFHEHTTSVASTAPPESTGGAFSHPGIVTEEDAAIVKQRDARHAGAGDCRFARD